MNWAEWILIIINLVLITFIFLQVKHIYRPILSIKILSREKGVQEGPDVLEYGELYSVISNISVNPASSIKIKYEFSTTRNGLLKIRKSLSYLNPNEATREPLDIGKIIKTYPELFQEHSNGNECKIIPKETLNIELKVHVSFKLGILPYRIRDSYKIEWGSLVSYPTFEDHPILNCWNTRDGHYIYKLG